jgi:anaerobic magnesium-protoporphyrin IX monomethyl ester cyclase
MVMARPEAITTHTMEVLKKIKTVMVMMGLESGSKEIREKICKRFMNEKFLFKAVKLLRENNVDSSMYNIVGFPTETRKQVFETIKLNHALKPNRMTVKILCPFEGTEMRDLAIEKGYITDEDDITAMYYDESCLDMPQLSPEDIKGLRKTFILYAKSPKFMWPLIKICENETPFANKIYKALSNSYWMKK